jgi:hypothetical protein
MEIEFVILFILKQAYMKAYLLCMLVVLLPLYIPVAMGQQSGRRSAMYQTWIQTRDGSLRIKGILYAVGDSAIYVSDALSRRRYESGDFQVTRIDYSQIERVQVRHIHSLSAGILTGAVLSGGVVFFALRSDVGDGWDPLLDGLLIILSVPPALVGGAVGGLVGGLKTSFQVHGNYQDFTLHRDRLNSYAFVKDSAGIRLPPKEQSEETTQREAETQAIEQQLAEEPPYREVESQAIEQQLAEEPPYREVESRAIEQQLAEKPPYREVESQAIEKDAPSSSGFFAAYSMGVVIPTADFADTQALNPKSGFAGVGITRNLQLGYDTQNSFLVSLQGSFNEYYLNLSRINKWIDAHEGLFLEQEFADFSEMKWRIFNVSAALSYAVPFSEKWIAELQLQLGYDYSRFKGDAYLFHYGQGPSYGFHTLFRHDRTPQWSFLIDAGYFISTQEMKYKYIQPGIKTRELQGYSLRAGILYRF